MSKHKQEDSPAVADIEIDGMRYKYVGPATVSPTKGCTLFKNLLVGHHFIHEDEEHIKIQDVLTAGGGYEISPKASFGVINNVCLTGRYAGQVSGMGDEVEVEPLNRKDSDFPYSHKFREITMENIKQIHLDSQSILKRAQSMANAFEGVFRTHQSR